MDDSRKEAGVFRDDDSMSDLEVTVGQFLQKVHEFDH